MNRPKSLLLDTPSLEQLEVQMAALVTAQREELMNLLQRHRDEMEALMRKVELCKTRQS
jgi:hypothetical protein